MACEMPVAPVLPGLETGGHVHSVETCGTVDGPGLRYVLFLSGCPLRCQYCHNPDLIGRPCGTPKTAGEVVGDILRYRNFLKRGGLTITGGEPLMQPEFVHAVFHAARREGIHTALDTSGFLGAKASDALLGETDLVLLDLKSWDPATFREVTGVSRRPGFEFASRLDALGKPVWIRFVLVPGLTDGEENIRGLARFVAGLGNVERCEILPFHKMGEDKYRQAGLPYQLGATPEPSSDDIRRARSIFAGYGVETS